MSKAEQLRKELDACMQLITSSVTTKRRRKNALSTAQDIAAKRMAVSTEPAYPEAMMELRRMMRN